MAVGTLNSSRHDATSFATHQSGQNQSQSQDDLAPKSSEYSKSNMNGHTNGVAIANNNERSTKINTLLQVDSEGSGVHDLLSLGFGPAGLAIAVALYDTLEDDHKSSRHDQRPKPKVRFLEKQDTFRWHAGMLLPGAKMQISCVKDMATLRNPRSHFTFFNYLKENKRLVQFTNLDTLLPLRVEFEDYLKWCASHFRDIVDYSQQVLRVRPCKSPSAGTSRFDCFEVTCRTADSATVRSYLTRNVVIAVGGQPTMPALFPSNLSNIFHSSQYQYKIADVLPDRLGSYKVAIVGSGQSSAEIFNDLQSRYPNSTTRMIIRDSALRPSDDSPFVNEIFDPEAVNKFYQRSDKDRAETVRENRATNYSVVRTTLLEQLYEELYRQRIYEPDEEKWQHRILTRREIMQVTESASNKTISMVMRSNDPTTNQQPESMEFDAVIVATGYTRNAHVKMLEDCQMINASPEGEWLIGRDYQVHLNRDMVQEGTNIYLQGSNEATHGLSDSLLSILATRAGELVGTVFPEIGSS